MSVLLLSVLLSQISYSPTEAQAIFVEGAEAYGRDDGAAAVAAYRKLLEHGLGGPDVEYNLGTAELAQGNLGEAVLHLERARRQGGGPDVDANLAIARGRVVDQVVGPSAEEGIVTRLVAATTSSAAAWAFLVPWCAAFLLLLFRRVRRPVRGTGAAAAALLVLAAPGAALLLAHVVVSRTVHEAVVLAKTLPVRKTPDSTSKVSFELHAGSEVRVLASTGAFAHLRLSNGTEGWAVESEVARLDEAPSP